MSKTTVRFEAVATIAKRHGLCVSALNRALESSRINVLLYGYAMAKQGAFDSLCTLVFWGESSELMDFIAKCEEERKSKNIKK